jgi:pimeloyl-ACP methyl ester carboxylesterase
LGLMPHLQVEVIKGHDHMTAFMDPEFIAAIRAFVGAHAAVEGRYFDSNGVRIRYVDRGPRDGEPVVLVHGFTQSIETAWGDPGVIDALDDDHRVIALDCRGHGRSDKPHDRDEYGDAMVDDVLRLLDHLGIEKAHVVGYSMGGRIVFKLLADHPQRVLSAMPCGMGWGPPSPEFEAGLERAARALEERGSIRAKIEHMVADDAVIERIEAMIRVSNDTKALAAVQRGIPALRPDRTKLEANAVPCLAIVGEHDALREPVDAMVEYMANLEVTIIEGADHGTAYRDPAFPAVIRAFIAKCKQDAMKQ